MLVIDDLHWADRPSSRAVLYALRRFAAGDSRVTRMRLGGLAPDDLTELALTLGLGVLSRRGASRLAAHTQGNALYCRALLEESASRG